MYLHIGNGHTVNSERILGIFSYEVKDLKNNLVLFDFLKSNKRFVYVVDEEEEFRSIVLTRDFKAYVTNISIATLAKRLKNSIY